jgi:ribosomal protein S18 acetylase RimI-like enzyme
MTIDIVALAEPYFESVRQVLDHVAREKRFLAFTEAPGAKEAYAFYRDIVANNHVFSVVLSRGEVVGWCDVLPLHGQARAHIGTLGMGLMPQMRNQGIGRKLIDYTIAKALEKGLTRIELTVRTDNANAKALYERIGFVSEGLFRRAFRIDGNYYDAYAMALLA